MENLRVAVMFVCYIYSCSFLYLFFFIFIRNLRVVVVFFCYIYSCSFLYFFKTSGWSWWWKRPRLSSWSILTFFLFSWSKNVLYFNILHINWPEDSIKLIQSNLELWTEFLIVSSYSTLILRKMKRAVGTSPNYITCLAHTQSYTTYKLKGIIYIM